MAEIYGSFGRVITGNTLGGSIGNLARQILYDKIRRIFSAYRDEVTYDGALLDAATAIAKLNEILAMVDPTSAAASDIKSYIDSIRQEDRTRRANKVLAELETQDASTRDYAKTIKALQEIMSDPTITDSEKQALKAQIAQNVRNLISNALKQYYEGGSITIDGKSIDLSLKGGGDQLLQLINSQMAAFPDMKSEIGKSYDIAQSSVIVKEADFAFASLTLKTDSDKLKAYQAQQAAYEKALDILKKSNYDLSESSEALDLMQSIQDITENVNVLNKNIAVTAANSRIEKFDKNIQSGIDALDAAGRKLLGGSRNQVLDDSTDLFSYLATFGTSAIDTLYDYVDKMVAENGGKTTLTMNGQTFDLSHQAIKQMVLQAARTAAEASRYANGNSNVRGSVQENFKKVADAFGAFILNNELFTVEDKYDSARSRLERDVIASNGDIFAIRAAYKEYGNTLNRLGATYADSDAADNLKAEGYFYVNGRQDPNNNAEFFGVWSMNQTLDYANATIAATQKIIMDTTSVRPDQVERYISIDGNVVYGVVGRDSVETEFGTVTKPAWTTTREKSTLTGLRLKDPLGGPANVYQTIAMKDSSGRTFGFVSIVNGQFVGGNQQSGGKYKFYTAASLNAALRANGITIANVGTKLTQLGDSSWLEFGLNSLKDLSTTGEAYTPDQIRAGKIVLPAGDESGIGDLTESEKQAAIDDILSEYRPEQFSYSGTTTRGEGQMQYEVSGLMVTIDGELYSAETLLGRAAAEAALQDWIVRKTSTTAPDPAEGTPPGPSGLNPRFPAGGSSAFGNTPNVARPTPSQTVQIPRGMETDEAQYNLQRTMLATPKATPKGGLVSGEDLRDSRPPTASPVKPVTPISGIKPVSTVTTSIKPMTVSGVRTTAGVAGDSIAERLAQARRTSQLASARSTVGGFFRNSPFKVTL